MGNNAELTFGMDDDKLLDQNNPAPNDDGTTGKVDDKNVPNDKQVEGEPGEGGKPGEQVQQQQPGKEPENQITHDPLKDTQRAFHQKAEEVKRLREENERLLQQMVELKKNIVGSFKKLSPEELETLKYDDPDAYLRYVQTAQQLENLDNQTTQMQQRISAQKSLEAFNSVVQQQLGIQPGTDEYNQFIHSQEFMKLDRWLTENVLPEPDGSYNEDGIKAAMYATLGDKILQMQRKRAAEQVVDNIQNAEKGKGVIDKAKGAEIKHKRKLSDYTQEEIAAMGEDELNALLELEE